LEFPVELVEMTDVDQAAAAGKQDWECASMKTQLVVALWMALTAGAAVAQEAAPGAHRPHHEWRSQGPKLVLDRGPGRGRIELECGPGEATRACLEAVLPLFEILPPDGGGGTGVVYSTTSIKCGNTVYEVSTGTKGGVCATSGPANAPVESATCNDGGNRAGANCRTGCEGTRGSGSCTIKSVR
jgi:hypothetical protein